MRCTLHVAGGAEPAAQPPLENVAQELYRVVFFVVFTLEVWCLSNLPLLGEPARWLGCARCPASHPNACCWASAPTGRLLLLLVVDLLMNSRNYYVLCVRHGISCKHPEKTLAIFESQRFRLTAGSLLNYAFLSWLYAYYCFDYKWSLQVSFFYTLFDFFGGGRGDGETRTAATGQILAWLAHKTAGGMRH